MSWQSVAICVSFQRRILLWTFLIFFQMETAMVCELHLQFIGHDQWTEGVVSYRLSILVWQLEKWKTLDCDYTPTPVIFRRAVLPVFWWSSYEEWRRQTHISEWRYLQWRVARWQGMFFHKARMLLLFHKAQDFELFLRSRWMVQGVWSTLLEHSTKASSQTTCTMAQGPTPSLMGPNIQAASAITGD